MLPTHFSCSPDRRARALTAWLAIVVSCVLHFSSVSAQSRLNYEADHVIRCGYPEDGIIIVNSGLNETYLIPPPPSLPKRLALPEGSRVINSRPLDDHSGEIGYQLRGDGMFLLEYANGTRSMMYARCDYNTAALVPKLPGFDHRMFYVSGDDLYYLDQNSHLHFYFWEGPQDTFVDQSHTGVDFVGLWRCRAGEYYARWDQATDHTIGITGNVAWAMGDAQGEFDVTSGVFLFNDTCAMIAGGSIWYMDPEITGFVLTEALSIPNANFSHAVSMEWQYEVVVRRTLETGEVVPCIINSLTGQVSCEDPSICVDPSEETATGTTINQVFFKCRANGGSEYLMHRYDIGSTSATAVAVSNPKFLVSEAYGYVWIFEEVSSSRKRDVTAQYLLYVWEDGSLNAVNSSFVINPLISIASPFDNTTSIVTLAPSADGVVEPHFIFKLPGGTFAMTGLGEFSENPPSDAPVSAVPSEESPAAVDAPFASPLQAPAGDGTIVIAPGFLADEYNGTVILAQPGRYIVAVDQRTIIRGSLIIKPEVILEVRERGRVVVFDHIFEEARALVELKWKAFVDSRQNTTLDGQVSLEAGSNTDPSHPHIPVVVGEVIHLGGELVVIALPELDSAVQVAGNATVEFGTFTERVGTFTSVTISGITLGECNQAVASDVLARPTSLGILIELTEPEPGCQDGIEQASSLPGWAIAIITVGVVLVVLAAIGVAVMTNKTLRSKILPYRGTIEKAH